MKAFLNNERCPLCGSQLEGPVRFDETELHCVTGGPREYKARFKYGLKMPVRTVITYYTEQFAYQLISTYTTDDKYQNIVFKLDLSLNESNQQASRKELFSYEGKRLILDKDKFMDKINLYTVFS